MDSGMYKPIQLAAVRALAYPPQWYAKLNKEYEVRHKLAASLFDSLGVKYDESQAGLFLWGQIPETFSNSYAFTDFQLKNNSLFITPGSIFGSNGSQYTRISLCSGREIFREAIGRITKKVALTKNEVKLCG